MGERQKAAELYPAALAAIERADYWLFGALLSQLMAGIAAACGGQWEKAEEHFQTALRQAHDMPVVIAQPEVRRWYARMLLERAAPGDREKARRLLTEAIELYRQIGMPRHIGMTEEMLTQ